MYHRVSLEFGNLQSLIYKDIAQNIAECTHEAEILSTVDLISASVDTHNTNLREAKKRRASGDEECPQRIYMVCSKLYF